LETLTTALGLNATLIAMIFHFLVLLLFLRLVVYKPLFNLLEKRQEFIASNVAAAEEERKQAEALRQQYLADMEQARAQAQDMIKKATKAGEEQARQIIEDAKLEATKVKENALLEIQREKEKAVVELREHVATLAVLVAAKIIDEKITTDIQSNLVDQFIKEAGDLPC